MNQGGADCPTGDLIGNQPSNETLDFGWQLRYYISRDSRRSLVCDPSHAEFRTRLLTLWRPRERKGSRGWKS